MASFWVHSKQKVNLPRYLMHDFSMGKAHLPFDRGGPALWNLQSAHRELGTPLERDPHPTKATKYPWIEFPREASFQQYLLISKRAVSSP